MQHSICSPSRQTAWSTPLVGHRRSASSPSSKCLHITVYDGPVSPMTFLRRLELLSGRIHRAAMQVRGKPYDGQGPLHSDPVFVLKVDFLAVDAAVKALKSITSKDPSLGVVENARVVASMPPSFSLDEEDVLMDLRPLHDAFGGTQHSPLSFQHKNGRPGHWDSPTEKRTSRSEYGRHPLYSPFLVGSARESSAHH